MSQHTVDGAPCAVNPNPRHHKEGWKYPTRLGPLTRDNLMSHVEVTGPSDDPCWSWVRCTTPFGHPVKTQHGKRELAHRLVFEMYHRPLSVGEVVRHRCDNPKCVNPDHLLAGSHGDNVADAVTRGRNAKGKSLPQSKLTPVAVRIIRERYGHPENMQELAEAFGVSLEAVSRVIRGESWKHVD